MKTFDALNHTITPLPHGGQILILDTGAVIPPEAEAMLQALYSRSNKSVLDHLTILGEKGFEKFMKTYYVGYGHKSIGDCGTATIFIEGVSMLAAKAIQDWQLYSGQESSTRYIDFSEQVFINPLRIPQLDALLERLRTFYLKGVEELQPYLMAKFPQQEGEKDTFYKKAIAARAFDIMRAFLPAGATTNVAWHSNLRQMADKIALLRHHPLEEVADIGTALEQALQQHFSSSFGHKRYEKTEQYNAWWMKEDYLFDGKHISECVLRHNGIWMDQLCYYRDIFEKRPPQTELPHLVDTLGSLQIEMLLDFGSFRDIQRHRAIVQRMPLLGTTYGFEEWYLNELPDDLRSEAIELLAQHEREIAISRRLIPPVAQYYVPMGYRTPNRISGSLRPLVYLVELRATRFVHPTARRRAREIGEILIDRFGLYGLTIHLDDDPDRFDIGRGEQDIVQVS